MSTHPEPPLPPRRPLAPPVVRAPSRPPPRAAPRAAPDRPKPPTPPPSGAYVVYLDDSYDDKFVAFSALMVPGAQWVAALKHIKQFRSSLRKSDGIFTSVELHAVDFVAGRGRPSDRIVVKSRRIEIYRQFLGTIATTPGMRAINAYFPKGFMARAFERLLNRLNMYMTKCNGHAILICDEGNESTYRALCRQLRAFNPIPSRFGTWSSGPWRDIPTDRVIEDPVFRNSKDSYFIQAADFSAYSLLRRENPCGPTQKCGASDAFNALAPIFVRQACRADPEGILRNT
jgi:hypothetical protein